MTSLIVTRCLLIRFLYLISKFILDVWLGHFAAMVEAGRRRLLIGKYVLLPEAERGFPSSKQGRVVTRLSQNDANNNAWRVARPSMAASFRLASLAQMRSVRICFAPSVANPRPTPLAL